MWISEFCDIVFVWEWDGGKVLQSILLWDTAAADCGDDSAR